MARLPTPGSDNNNWGSLLNQYLSVSHDSAGRLKNLFINVMDYGATGDGTTDDTSALQSAADAAADAGLALFIPDGLTFKISSTLTIKGSCYATGATITTASALAPAVDIRNASGGAARLEQVSCYLPNVTQTSQVWAPGSLPTGADGLAGLDTGVRLTNLLSGTVHCGTITAFSVGLYCYATGSAGFNSYNTIFLGKHQNNKVNLLVGTDNNTTNSATASACNQQTFIGGRLAHYGPPTNSANTTGVRQILIDAAASQVNNIMVIGTSLEGDTPEWHVDNFGRDIVFMGCRWEVSAGDAKYRRGTTTVTCQDDSSVGVNCRNDTIFYGYNSEAVVVTNSSGASGHSLLNPSQIVTTQATLSGSAGLNATAGQVRSESFTVGSSGAGPTWTTGSGSPEGSVTAPVGSLFSRSDGGAGTSLYVKESGTDNTGWVGK